jgi:hypothetical protein
MSDENDRMVCHSLAPHVRKRLHRLRRRLLGWPVAESGVRSVRGRGHHHTHTATGRAMTQCAMMAQ